MAAESNRDPLELGGLDPAAIATAIQDKKSGTKKPLSELEMQKEARLASKEKRLNGGTPSAGPKAPVSTDRSPPTPPPPEVDKSALLDKLVAYKERFPHLKKRNNVSVKSSADDILDELHYFEMQLGSKQDMGDNKYWILGLGGPSPPFEDETEALCLPSPPSLFSPLLRGLLLLGCWR